MVIYNDSENSPASLLVGKNSDPQTGWMKEEVLEQTGYSFQVDKFQQLSTIRIGNHMLLSAIWE